MFLARVGRVVRPMLASPGKTMHEAVKFAVDDAYELTPKMDGTRLAVTVGERGAIGWARSGDMAKIPSAVAENIPYIPGMTLDGELLGDVYVVFDAPTYPNMVDGLTLDRRRFWLEAMFDGWDLRGPGSHVRLCPRAVTLDEKADMIHRIDVGRGEGLVAKRLDSTYQEGVRSRDWIKLKRHHTIDCVVTWLGDPKHNMGLAVYRDGNLVDVGECGTLTGEGLAAKVGDVVEVRVLYASDSGRLVQPTLPKLRADKQPHECTWDQIEAAATNKNLVLEMT